MDASDMLGASASLDGNRMVFGTYGADGAGNGFSASGEAYLFTFSNGDFTGIAHEGTIGRGYSGGKNLGLALEASDGFGVDVSLDGNRLIDPVLVAWNHPVRLTVSLLVPFLLLPEITMLTAKATGLSGAAASSLAIGFIVFVIFLPQLVVEALNCHHIAYDFHDDHYSFTESFLVREAVRVPYRSIAAIRHRQNAVQKMFGVGTISVVTETRLGQLPPKETVFEIPDVRHAARSAEDIRKLVSV